MHSQPDTSSSVVPNRRPPKKRGSYNCGRCGVPKKGHVCASNDAMALVVVPSPAPPRAERLRRALSFDDLAADPEVGQPEEEWDPNDGTQLPVPPSCMAEVLRRLSPKEMMRAACVCRGWRDLVRRAWYSAEEIRIKVDRCGSSIGFVGSVLNRCEGLVKLRLTMESDADATVLACVAFSCPNLESFEMKITNNAVNRITGDELGRFVSEKRSLSVVKIEGCVNLGSLNLCSSNLVSIIDCLGRSCLKLRNIHIASSRLCNEVVLALAGANLRDKPLLPSGTYTDDAKENFNQEKKITMYVEHPLPIEPPVEPASPPPQPLKLTKKEQKKLRTQRRLAKEKDRQEMIRQGLLEPPKPKVKMSNLMKVLGSEATQDPTRMEMEIRIAAAEREQAHVDRNIA